VSEQNLRERKTSGQEYGGHFRNENEAAFSEAHEK
jgi:hypothetical protein